ncbi:EAL and HDOD domain-containing protein [Actinomarinicola tropica]|uniref:HDOD domain-containing protein n=1 Tax=Actinomarinicola tropica TaxID=2789776 RepID=A0A5Q2RN95_9ACTN|nr:HDOD domain-containing protein [Actinomarinicola tropica]QGG94665.1 HDOD domain-containing protein [Actinomarinicola tropica]
MSDRRPRTRFRSRSRRRVAEEAPATPDWTDVVAEAPLHPITVGDAGGGTTYIGRAPVFDRRLDVCGYHLIVDRLDDDGHAAGDASRQLLTRALLEVGLDSLIGGRTGFVEVTVDLLAEGLHHALPAHRMMIEVAGRIDAAGEEVLRAVRDEGYPLIVGSLAACERPDRVLPIAGGLRADVRVGELEAASEALARHNPRGKLLVTGLAHSAEVEPCRAAGATWLRGDVLRPVERIDEPTVPANRVAVLQLLAELERPDVEVDDIDALISIDLGMSYKVLRMANSSYLALERRVERTRDAVVYLGIDTVRAVAALLALSEATDHPPEIVHQSLLRARHCEEILLLTHPSAAHAGFTTGLFSALDLLLGLSVEQVLHRIPVSDEIAEALRSRQGVIGRTLDVVIAYERHDLDRLARGRIEPATVVSGYRNALAWVSRITRGLEPAPV